MRKQLWKVLLFVGIFAVSFGAYSTAVRADGGSTYEPGDGRINPSTADRIAVYLNDSGAVVWGVDNNDVGFALTSFSAAEFSSGKTISHQTAQGTVTLHFVSPATWHTGYSDYSATSTSTIVDTGAVYTVTWTGGAYGADGSAAFSKTFSATFGLPQ